VCFGRNLNGVLMNGMECHVNWTVCFVDLFVNVCVNWYMLKGEGEGEGEGEVRDRKQETYTRSRKHNSCELYGSQKERSLRLIQEKVQSCARLYGDKDSD